jgi:hypothetical protein
MEWFIFSYFALSALLMFLLGTSSILITLKDMPWHKTLMAFTIGIVTIVFSFYIIGRFLAPVNIALMIKKHLKNKKA